jgi:uncharacterized repeat protein (TIGR01451 family)
MKKAWVFLLMIIVGLPVAAFAQPAVTINITAEKEVTVEEKGQLVTRKIAADTVEPGEIIFYTLTYANTGDQVANGVVINDPIPKGAAYISGTATGANSVITFSIDDGKTFKSPSLLTYEIKRDNGKPEKRVASPEEYTHIRWTVGSVAAGASGLLSFQAIIQ